MPSNTSIRLRPAVEDDAPAILTYFKQIGAESDFVTFGAEGISLTEAEERAIVAKAASSPTTLMLIAEDDGAIVGVLTFAPGNRPRTQHLGTLGISIAQSHWGAGIARQLMGELEEWARAGGVIRKVNLHVRTDNTRAIRLYESLGYVTEGRTTRDMLIGDVFYDALIMGLEIDPD